MIVYLALALWGFVVFHYIAFFNIWYWTYPWLDTVMHFAGGALLAGLALYIFFERYRVNVNNVFVKALMVFGFVAFAGVLWEWHEFVADLFIKNPALVMQAGVGDTMLDLFFELLGASIVFAIYLCLKPLSSPAAKN